MSHEPGSSPRARLRLRRRWLFVAALVSVLVVAVPVAWASHGFTDVPDSNPFHNDIDAIADAGITSGKTCVPPGTPPTFCPNEPVVRQGMAAFMRRGFTRGGGTPFGNDSIEESFTTLDNGGTLTIQAGGAAGGIGFLKIDAQVGMFANSPGTTCPCEAIFRILVDGADPFSWTWTQFTDIGTGGYGIDQSALTGVVPVSTGTTHTIEIQAQEVSHTGDPLIGFGHMSAIYFPFGSTGGSTLSATGPKGGPS
jgi:hypothetical protein